MLIANLILFAFSAASLFYVVRYRIHIYATYELRDRTPKKRVSRTAVRSRDTADKEELVQTLVSLGAKTKVAQNAVMRALEESSPDDSFNEILKSAIQECQTRK